MSPKRCCANCGVFVANESPPPGAPDGFCYLYPPEVIEKEIDAPGPALAVPDAIRAPTGKLVMQGTRRPPVRSSGFCGQWRSTACLPGERGDAPALRTLMETVSSRSFLEAFSRQPSEAMKQLVDAYRNATGLEESPRGPKN